jgi:glycosyltransferase involved in cell wall biosynthesis
MGTDSFTIFHVIAQLRLGAGRVVADAAIEQARGRGHRVTVCVSADADEHWRTDPRLVSELARHNIAVRTIGDFFHRRTDLLHEAAARLRELRTGSTGTVIVHAHTAMAAAVGHWAGPGALIATCHGWGIGRTAEMDLQDSLAYQLCDSVVTYSRYWADRLVSDLAVPSPVILPMGLDLERFPRLPEKQRCLSDPLRLVTVCELTPRKGVDLLLNAMPAVWERRPEAELHIVGHGESTADLQLLAAKLDPGMTRVFFHGAVPHPYDQLANYDLFVLASRSDNLPVAILEAMLAGLPIVATAVGGVPDLISAAGCGRVLPPESSAALAEATLAMAEQGRRKLAALGRKGERFGRRRFDGRKANLEIERIYRAALRRGRRKRPHGQ